MNLALADVIVYPVLLVVFALLFTREVIAPASQNHCDRRWLLLASGLGGLSMVCAVGAGFLLSVTIRSHALLPLPEGTPDIAVGAVSFLATSFVFYWWHRATHASDFLWRHVHQLHHSPSRIESLTAFYAHPLDTMAAVLIGAVCSYALFGASPVGAAWALFFTGVFDLFLHADLHTPRWLGRFITRPEMHRVHHAHSHHAQNYGLPVWDLLFGTWNNPSDRVERCGFDDDKASQIGAMLRGKDVKG
ncbi:MAG: hypothetical protein RLZZ618_1086 [Pseudomonadota bacterium]